MALTKERVRTHRTQREEDPRPQYSRGTQLMVMIGWAVLMPIMYVLEPDVPGSTPWIVNVAAFAFLAAILTAIAGLLPRQRWGLSASLVASSINVTAVFLCPATGHHQFGFWWFGQFAAALALVAISGVAFLRSTTK